MTILIEAPIARLVIETKGLRDAIGILREIDESEESRRAVEDVLTTRLERNETDGDIHYQSVFALREPDEGRDNGVFWDDRGVVARGGALPEMLLAQVAGDLASDLINHRLLEGLVADAARNEDGCLVIDIGDSLWTIERIEADTCRTS